MKLSLFKTSESSEIAPQKQAPFLMLTIAVLVTGTILIWSIHQSYKTNRLQSVRHEEAMKIAELRVAGKNLNESSAMAARMAAATGDSNWENLYRDTAPEFIKIAEEAKSLAKGADDENAAEQIVKAQAEATGTENKAFALIHEGRRKDAQRLLESDDYKTQKKNYSENLDSFLAKIDEFQSFQEEKSNQNALWLLIAEIVLLAFFIWSWLAVIDNLRRSRKTLLAQVAENKGVEERLQKNVALLSSAFEATEDGIMIVDSNNMIVDYNNQYIEMWQIPEHIIESRDNKKALDFVYDQLLNAEDFIEKTEQLKRQPETKSSDLVFFKDGRVCERFSQPHIINGKVAGRVLSFRNITNRRHAEKALLESQESYQQLFDNNPHPVWVYDFETLQILAVNDEAMRHYGYTREEFLSMTLKDFCLPETVASEEICVSENSADERKTAHCSRHKKKNGAIIDVEISSSPIKFVDRPARLQLATDITNRKLSDAALRESEYKLRTLLDNMNEGLSQVDTNNIIEFVNDRFCEMTGYRREELLRKSVIDIFMDEDGQRTVEEANRKRLQGISSQYEIRIKRKSGEVLWVIIGGAPIFNAQNELIGSMGVFTDITERKLAEQKLLHDALHDGLTGLANRTLFINHLQKAIERGKRSNHALYAVLFLDFDRFKVINDSLGHAEGDNLLKQIARRLENLLRSGDLMARLGGDEFTILLNELTDSHDAVVIAERIQKDLKEPFILGEQEIFMSASIGITFSNDGHYRAEDMLRDADIAMYRAKSKGKAQHQIFEATMHANAINKLQLETEMHQALQRGEFSLSYQPIVNIETNNLAGFEALIRWNHPERGTISPGDFIAAAEENGLVVPLGRWILYESCRQMREWQKRFAWTSALMVSVNLSCKQFLQSDLGEQVTAALISTQLNPRCLKLEITETHVMENSNKAVTMMNKLRAIGVGISLDDFGTGYSSLSYLHRLPVNYLKIDRSFVNRMVESRENREIVYTIVKLAQNLRMEVIAEGIETIEQFEQLKNIGCEFGQGYFISKPMDAETTGDYLGKATVPEFSTVDSQIINAEQYSA